MESQKVQNFQTHFLQKTSLTLKFMKKSIRIICGHSLAPNRRLINLKKNKKEVPKPRNFNKWRRAFLLEDAIKKLQSNDITHQGNSNFCDHLNFLNL